MRPGSSLPPVRTDRLLERLDLEVNVRDVVIRLPLFCGFVACFLLTWRGQAPPGEHLAVRRRLDAALGLSGDRLDGVRSLDDVYSYMQELNDRHKALNALDADDWCEERFFDTTWDALGSRPRPTCSRRSFAPLEGSSLLPSGSARLLAAYDQDALLQYGDNATNDTGLLVEPEVVVVRAGATLSFTVKNLDHDRFMERPDLVAAFETAVKSTIVGVLPADCTTEHISLVLSPGSVRVQASIVAPPTVTADEIHQALLDNLEKLKTSLLSAIRAIPGIADVSTGELTLTDFTVARVGPTCVDYDAALAKRLGRSLNCTEAMPEVCALDVGVSLCASSCNLCGPYRYKRVEKFVGPMTTILPLVAFQSRFEAVECDGFAAQYDVQAANPELFLNPPLDGQRNGKLTTCVDRTKPLSAPYALEVPCLASECPESVYRDTAKFSEAVRGQTVYPRLLASGVDDFARMRAVQWLDAQTGVASIAGLVYTEGVEMFTAVTVDFHIDAAGAVTPEVHARSWKVLSQQERDWVAGFVCFGIFFVLVSVGHTFWRLKTEPNLTGAAGFELCTRAVLFAMLVAVPVWKFLDADDCAQRFEDALRIYGEVPNPASPYGSARLLPAFFAAHGEVEQKAQEADNMNVVCFVAMCIQAIQLAVYFHVHPRTGVLTATAVRAAERLSYLLAIFAPCFFFVVFLAFWMFGSDLAAFRSYGDAAVAHVRMLFGEFLQAPGALELQGADSGMYWIHALVFMAIFFLLLRFLFLAVVVDAYGAAKAQRTVTAFSAPYDALDSLLVAGKFRKARWPEQPELARLLRASVAETSDAPTAPASSSAVSGAELHLRHALISWGLDDEDAKKEASNIVEYYRAKVPLIQHSLQKQSAEDEGEDSSAAAEKVYPKLDSKRVAQKVVQEVTNMLAEKPPEELDRFVTIGLLSCVISREFRACGLVS
eukprot:TRINITY_DN24352_c0_g2_i1.p1 TRINITY_DN24352_c0_g2~~TRINITY_DN24352_c0_g2_i1.p1  ORF type:complete len:978 (-),score=193.85 TRINITY_DN24352_c0_g2_i1:83-2905(-)